MTNGKVCVGCKNLNKKTRRCILGHPIIMANASNGGVVQVPGSDFNDC